MFSFSSLKLYVAECTSVCYLKSSCMRLMTSIISVHTCSLIFSSSSSFSSRWRRTSRFSTLIAFNRAYTQIGGCGINNSAQKEFVVCDRVYLSKFTWILHESHHCVQQFTSGWNMLTSSSSSLSSSSSSSIRVWSAWGESSRSKERM